MLAADKSNWKELFDINDQDVIISAVRKQNYTEAADLIQNLSRNMLTPQEARDILDRAVVDVAFGRY